MLLQSLFIEGWQCILRLLLSRVIFLVRPNLSNKKPAKQPSSSTENPVNKKGIDWLLGGFLFGTEIGGSSKKITLYLSLSFCWSGHVPHHSDQMSQRSQVSRIALWGCSLNAFVFVFIFVLVSSCLLVTP